MKLYLHSDNFLLQHAFSELATTLELRCSEHGRDVHLIDCFSTSVETVMKTIQNPAIPQNQRVLLYSKNKNNLFSFIRYHSVCITLPVSAICDSLYCFSHTNHFLPENTEPFISKKEMAILDSLAIGYQIHDIAETMHRSEKRIYQIASDIREKCHLPSLSFMQYYAGVISQLLFILAN